MLGAEVIAEVRWKIAAGAIRISAFSLFPVRARLTLSTEARNGALNATRWNIRWYARYRKPRVRNSSRSSRLRTKERERGLSRRTFLLFSLSLSLSLSFGPPLNYYENVETFVHSLVQKFKVFLFLFFSFFFFFFDKSRHTLLLRNTNIVIVSFTSYVICNFRAY